MTLLKDLHAVSDPVHGIMQFASKQWSVMKPLIDSPNFQRLRHIKQVGMTDVVFPGAVHTRFNHSIGCSYIAGMIADHIGLDEQETLLVMQACLLHDIGHGPFSHAFEKVFYDPQNNVAEIRHEEWTPYFLFDEQDTRFVSNDDRKHVLDLICHRSLMEKSDKRAVLFDIVSSQLDADRLDYLLRDSHFCGVSYGLFDLKWLINCLCLVRDPETTMERLAIRHKGMGIVEHFLIARRLMNQNVYFHGKKQASERLLIYFLDTLTKALCDDLLSKDAFLNPNLVQLLRNIQKYKQGSYENKDAFLKANYVFYKALTDADVWSAVRFCADSDVSSLRCLAEKLLHRKMPKILQIRSDAVDHVAQAIEDAKDILNPWELFIVNGDVESYSTVNGRQNHIFVKTKSTDVNQSVLKLDQGSLIIASLSGKRERSLYLCVDHNVAQNHDLSKVYEKIVAKNWLF